MTASESKHKFCVSIVDPTRPAWFVRHYNYYLHLEHETGPRNAHIFDDDASFFLVEDKFYTGYYALESINYPHHYISVANDGRTLIAKYEDTQHYRDHASFALVDHFLKRKTAGRNTSGHHALGHNIHMDIRHLDIGLILMDIYDLYCRSMSPNSIIVMGVTRIGTPIRFGVAIISF